MKIQTNFNKRFWLNRLLPFLKCRHFTVSVEENAFSRYGTHTLYMYCLKCGRSAEEISWHCKHELNIYGDCKYCLQKIEDYCENTLHEWTEEFGTDKFYCEKCGEWKDIEENDYDY